MCTLDTAMTPPCLLSHTVLRSLPYSLMWYGLTLKNNIFPKSINFHLFSLIPYPVKDKSSFSECSEWIQTDSDSFLEIGFLCFLDVLCFQTKDINKLFCLNEIVDTQAGTHALVIYNPSRSQCNRAHQGLTQPQLTFILVIKWQCRVSNFCSHICTQFHKSHKRLYFPDRIFLFMNLWPAHFFCFFLFNPSAIVWFNNACSSWN